MGLDMRASAREEIGRQIRTDLCDHILELLRADCAVAIFVKHLEGLLNDLGRVLRPL